MNNNVRPGYKRTEIGVIPDDWSIATIAATMKLVNGCAFKPSEWSDVGLPIIRIQNLNDPSASFNYYPHAIDDRNRIKPGDLLFAWSGTLGSSFGARVWQGPEGVLNQHIFKVLPDKSKISPEYAHVIFEQIGDEIARKSHGFKASFVHVKKSDLDATLLPVPKMEEQRAIATALSDMDALISGLDQLIAKKRDIKQATMQQLLTGQTRLPGFSGEWEVKRLGDVLSVRHGKNQHAVETRNGCYPILATGGQIGRTDTFLYDKPSVLIGRKGTIDRPIYRDQPFWSVDTLFYTEINRDANPKFIYYKFLMVDWRSYNEASGVPSLNASTIEAVEINIPSISEQAAIAAILSDMDAELASLEARRDKAKQLKQGMMQELLTGRIRLECAANS